MRVAALALGLVATPALAQPVACEPPATIAAPPVATPDGPARMVPITNYTLALTWVPEFCKTHGDAPDAALECGKRAAQFGFALHGLWPDGDNGTWPQWCPARPPATLQVPAGVVRRMLCTTPSPSLIAHEWAKHGTCMAASAQIYFAQSSGLFHALHFPDMNGLARHAGLTAGDLRAAFGRANPRYPRESVGLLLGEGGALQELRLCHDRALHPAACQSRVPADNAPVRITPR